MLRYDVRRDDIRYNIFGKVLAVQNVIDIITLCIHLHIIAVFCFVCNFCREIESEWILFRFKLLALKVYVCVWNVGIFLKCIYIDCVCVEIERDRDREGEFKRAIEKKLYVV